MIYTTQAVVSGTGRLVTFLITRRPNKDGTGFYQIIGAPETEQFETLASLVGFYASDNYTSIGVKLVRTSIVLICRDPNTAYYSRGGHCDGVCSVSRYHVGGREKTGQNTPLCCI